MKDQLSWLHHVLSPTNVCKKNWVQATMAWYGVSKYQCGVLLIDMNHVVCCCVMTRHTEVMVTFASLALKPWKCYKEIVEFGGWNDCGRSWKIYITQRYGCASKISSPKIQLVSYENSSISIWKETFDTQDHHISILLCYIYIYCLSTCWRCIVSSNHICQRSQPQPIVESEFLMVFGSTRPGTVLRGDLQLLKIGPPIPVKGEGLQGGWCHGGEVPGGICSRLRKKRSGRDIIRIMKFPYVMIYSDGRERTTKVWEVRILRVGTGKSLEYCQV